MDFKSNLKNSLLEFNFGQLIEFVWICAVRSIPFLSKDGTFECWDVKRRQYNIYNIFHALDLLKAHIVIGDAIPLYNSAYHTDSAFAVAYAFDAFLKGAAYYELSPEVEKGLSNEAPYESILLSISAADVLVRNGRQYNIDFETIVFADVENIKTDSLLLYNDTKIYGDVWSRFENALNIENCNFWYQLYKNIFDNRFILDREVLKKRVYIPDKMKDAGASAIARHLKEEVFCQEFQLNEARIIILGDKGAGKTSIARRLCHPQCEMPRLEESTAGVDTILWKIDDKNLNAHIWDFAGHTVTHAVHQIFLSERCLYILVCDGKTDNRERLFYWLNHVKNYGGNSEVIILLNKKDKHTPDIPENTLKERYPIVGIYKFSVRDDAYDLNKFREAVIDYITNHPSWNKKEIPITYYQVKQKLEEMFDKGKDYGVELISRNNFDKIAQKYSIEETEELLKDLHDLGIGLWYKSLEKFDTLILNPEWISHGVYQIINWAHEKKRYKLSLKDFQTIFSINKKRYSSNMYGYLFNLMVYYELAYEIDEETLVIPHLLNEDRPIRLPVFPNDSLMLKYEADTILPPNTISRFIVRHNQEIAADAGQPLVWRYGVVLKDNDGNVALVREEDRTINVTVKGKSKTYFLDRLRYTLNEIFKSYQSTRPELFYRVEQKVWMLDEQILNFFHANKSFYDYKSKKDIDMKETIEQYHININNSLGTNVIINSSISFDHSKLELEENLKKLYEELMRARYAKEALEVNDLRKAVTDAKSKKDWKEGINTVLYRFISELKDPDSIWHRNIENINNGIALIDNISRAFSIISQFIV